jgi:hypothetical protein
LDTYLSHLGFSNEVLMTKFGKAEKNRTVRFAKPEYPVLAVLEQNQGRS